MKNLILLSFILFSLNINAQNVYDISRDYLSSTYLLDVQGKIKPKKFVKVSESLLRTEFSDSVRYEMVIATINKRKKVKIQKRIFTGKPPIVIITNERKWRRIKYLILIGYKYNL